MTDTKWWHPVELSSQEQYTTGRMYEVTCNPLDQIQELCVDWTLQRIRIRELQTRVEDLEDALRSLGAIAQRHGVSVAEATAVLRGKP